LGILVSQIEIEIIFSIIIVFTTLTRCQFQIDNLDKLIFVHKNWPSDLHVGCLKPSNLADFCEVEFNLTYELDVEFVDEVKHEEYVDGDL